jgi:hypothetical protein
MKGKSFPKMSDSARPLVSPSLRVIERMDPGTYPKGAATVWDVGSGGVSTGQEAS